jgi:hypothetical protein
LSVDAVPATAGNSTGGKGKLVLLAENLTRSPDNVSQSDVGSNLGAASMSLIGASAGDATPPRELTAAEIAGGRLPTAGEVAALRTTFSGYGKYDPTLIRIFYDSTTPDTGWVDGYNLHLPSKYASCFDFTTCLDGKKLDFFLHEAAHTWQAQNGISAGWGYFIGRFTGDSVQDPKTGHYLPLEQFKSLPSPYGLPTEHQADWFSYNYFKITEGTPR